MKTSCKFLLCLSLVLLTTPVPAAKPDQAAILTDAVSFYNSAVDAGVLEKALRADGDPDAYSFSKATIKGQKIFIEDVKYPLEVKDLNKREFMLNHVVLRYSEQTSQGEMFEKIERALNGRQARSDWWNLVLPQAHASVVPAVASIYFVGLVVSFLGCSVQAAIQSGAKVSGSGTACLGSALTWPYIAASGVIAAASQKGQLGSLPSIMDCSKAPSGGRSQNPKISDYALSAARKMVAFGCSIGLKAKVDAILASAKGIKFGVEPAKVPQGTQ